MSAEDAPGLGLHESFKASVDQDQRFRTLERDLGRLEGVVESLVSSVRMEHETARAARADDRLALSELGETMEKAVSGLAEEVKKLAKESAKQDATISMKQANSDGAIGFSRWLLNSGIGIAALIIALLGSRQPENKAEPLPGQSCPIQPYQQSPPKSGIKPVRPSDLG